MPVHLTSIIDNVKDACHSWFMTEIRPLSPFNKVFIPLLAICAILGLARGQWFLALMVIVGVVAVGISVWRAQRGRGGVFERISAAQAYDERDHELQTTGFAWLGMLAFILQTLVVLVSMAINRSAAPAEAVRLLVLAVGLGVANWIAVRRA